jgi:chemotaxis protein methyltransferase CheR
MLADKVRTAEGAREFAFSNEEFEYISSLVYDRSGIVLASHKKDMVYTRLARRLRMLGLKSFRDYCALIQSERGSDEIGPLINAITTNLTKFFRENHHFEHLRQVVLRDLAELSVRGEKKRLRIWSAGCSSGEEPYSIAITAAEGFGNLAQWDARILATDLDTSMVAKASAGVYPDQALTEVSSAIRLKYFERECGEADERWAVVDRLRRLIAFKQLNLLQLWPIKGPFDAIFCRNVMIYFDGPTKTELVRRFAGLLKPRGWLYVGHSESLLDDQSSFKLNGRTIYRKIG